MSALKPPASTFVYSKPKRKMRRKLKNIYNQLYAHFGPRHWWPAKTPFEVMVGAILTQNTAWSNVEKAIENLKRENALSLRKIKRLPLRKLAALIKPSGFYNDKAKKLKALVKFLNNFSGGRLARLRGSRVDSLRQALLGVAGIGPETADSILLYALGKSVFVVDAYTKRIFARHELISEKATYEEIQNFFMSNLPRNPGLFNEYHALIVETGKHFCKKKNPRCEICPLSVFAKKVEFQSSYASANSPKPNAKLSEGEKVVKRGKNMVYCNK